MSEIRHDLPSTALCRHTNDAIWYRDKNLVDDILGKETFTTAAITHILGRTLDENQMAMLDAVLICLMEHGLTPSAISARLIYMSSPGSFQAGVAAGLLGVGSAFIGTMENCAVLLEQIAMSPDAAITAATIANQHIQEKKACPGFGHHLHQPDDPRATALLDMARIKGISGKYIAALMILSSELDEARGKRHLTINATGAIAAILCELNIPSEAMRGVAIIARAAGLVAHLVEEQRDPNGRIIWQLVDQAAGQNPPKR